MTEMSCETKRTVICAVRPRSSAPVMSDLSIATKRVSTVSPLLFALADRSLEAVVDVARQQVLERAPVAFRVGEHDHLVGGARAGDEMLGVERRVLARRWRRARRPMAEPASAMPFQRSVGSAVSAAFCALSACAAGKRDHVVVGRAAHRIARGIGIIRRPFPAGALAKHAAQAQEDEYRQRQKDDGADIEHVLHALGSRDGRNRGISGEPHR